MGHLLRKRHHHQGKTEHRRVERIVADAAIQVLAEQHGADAAALTVSHQGQ